MFWSLSSKKSKTQHIHDWEKWRIHDEGQLLVNKRVVGIYMHQKRTCKTCGLIELKETGTRID